jgi:hypothetical protein
MALRKCKECGKEVSTKAEACPNCGAPIKQKSKEYGCIASLLMLIGGAVVLLVIVAWLFFPDTQGSKAQEIEACTNRGIAYFKAIGSYPQLKTAPSRSADEEARERCTRTTGAFDISDADLRSLQEVEGNLSDEEYARKAKLLNEAFARKRKLADEASARKRKLADEKEAERLAAIPHRKWSDSTARTTCARDLHSTYNYPLAINTFVGMQPHENDTTLVGLALIDKRPDYDGKNVTVGCVYSHDGSLVTIFFNTKIAGWVEPPKR